MSMEITRVRYEIFPFNKPADLQAATTIAGVKTAVIDILQKMNAG